MKVKEEFKQIWVIKCFLRRMQDVERKMGGCLHVLVLLSERLKTYMNPHLMFDLHSLPAHEAQRHRAGTPPSAIHSVTETTSPPGLCVE